MSWLYKYFRLVLGSTYPALQLHDATLTISGTGATLTLASGAAVNEFSIDGTLAGDSDTAIPTEKAVKAYVDASPAGTVTLTGVQALSNKSLTMEGGTPLAAIAGTPLFTIGSLTAAMSSTKVANFIAMQVSITQAADIGSGNTVGASYFRTATGIAQTGQLATCMVRASLAHNVFDAYGLQSHLSITASMGTVNANAHLTAISGKITLTGTPTVATGWGTAGLFILEGAGSFTQMCSAVSLVQEAGCSAAKEMLYINNDGTVTVGINFVGNFTKGITFNNATVSQGLDNFILSLGTINSTISYTPSDSYVPIQVNLTSIADHGTSGNETIGATYLRTATSTANQPNHQLATCMVRVKVANNIWDAYGVQSHLSFGNVTVSTTGNNAHLTAISGKVTFDTTIVSKGWVTAGLFIIEGAGTCSQLCYGVSIVEEAGSTGCQALLHLNTDVGVIPALKISATSATGGTVYEATDTHQTFVGSIKINVNGTDRYLHYCDDQAATS